MGILDFLFGKRDEESTKTIDATDPDSRSDVANPATTVAHQKTAPGGPRHEDAKNPLGAKDRRKMVISKVPQELRRLVPVVQKYSPGKYGRTAQPEDSDKVVQFAQCNPEVYEELRRFVAGITPGQQDVMFHWLGDGSTAEKCYEAAKFEGIWAVTSGLGLYPSQEEESITFLLSKLLRKDQLNYGRAYAAEQLAKRYQEIQDTDEAVDCLRTAMQDEVLSTRAWSLIALKLLGIDDITDDIKADLEQFRQDASGVDDFEVYSIHDAMVFFDALNQ